MVDRRVAATSFAWSAVENGGLIVISLACLILFARLLTPAEFGVFSIAWSIVELLGVVVSMFFHDALVQRAAISDEHVDSAFTATIVLSIAAMLLVWAGAGALADATGQPELGPIMRWLVVALPCSAIGAVVAAVQRRAFHFRALALRSLVARGVGGVVAIGIAIAGAGLWSLVVQQILMALLGSVILWVTADRVPRLRFHIRAFRDLFGFGLCSISALFLRFTTRRLFTVATGIALGPEEAGYLNLAFRSVEMLWGVAATGVSQVALPLLSRQQSDPAQLRRSFALSVKLASLALAPCFVGLAMLAPIWIQLGFGARWLPSAPSAMALCALYVIQSPQLFASPLLVAVRRVRDTLAITVVEMAAMLLAITIAPIPDALAAVLLWLAIQLAYILTTAWLLRRASGITFHDQIAGAAKPLAAAIVMGAAIWFAGQHVPPSWSLTARLVALTGLGALTFASMITVLDRTLMDETIRMSVTAVRRRPRNA